MVRTAGVALLVMLFALTVTAEDTVKGFAFRTVDGRMVDYRALHGAPLVVNVGAHW